MVAMSAYFPFDAGAGASSFEDRWREMLSAALPINGVIPARTNELGVIADSTGVLVKVNSGSCWIAGHVGRQNAQVSVNLTTPPGSNSRIDRIVARLDAAANTVSIEKVDGIAAATPSAPAINNWPTIPDISSVTTVDIPLAQVLVVAGDVTIAAGRVTDERHYAHRHDPGDMTMWAGSSPPQGALLCQGQAVSRAVYARLFAKIGTAWGAGDGSTTFNVPDYAGRAPIGSGTGSGLSARTIAQKLGAETHPLAIGEMPAHPHAIDHLHGAHNHEVFWADGTNGGLQIVQVWASGITTISGIARNVDAGRAITDSKSLSFAGNSGSAGGSAAHNNMQPSTVCPIVIWY